MVPGVGRSRGPAGDSAPGWPEDMWPLSGTSSCWQGPSSWRIDRTQSGGVRPVPTSECLPPRPNEEVNNRTREFCSRPNRKQHVLPFATSCSQCDPSRNLRCPEGAGSNKAELRLPDESDAAGQLKTVVGRGQGGSKHCPWPPGSRVATVHFHEHHLTPHRMDISKRVPAQLWAEEVQPCSASWAECTKHAQAVVTMPPPWAFLRIRSGSDQQMSITLPTKCCRRFGGQLGGQIVRSELALRP